MRYANPLARRPAGLLGRAAVPAVLLATVALAGCWGPKTGSGPGIPPPSCHEGQGCTGHHGQPGVCLGGTCETYCPLGLKGCCLASRDCVPPGATVSGSGPGRRTAVCDYATGTCELACTQDIDCASTEPTFGPCHGSYCVCDTGRCVVPPCATNADCPVGLRCVAGSCGTGIAAASCRVLPGRVLLTPGARRGLHALAEDGKGVPGAPETPVTWSTGDASVAKIDRRTGALEGGPEPGATWVTATAGDATCHARVETVAGAAPGTLEVAVVDPAGDGPLAGVTVVARRGAAELASGTTGPGGEVVLKGLPAGPLDVDVLPLGPDGTPNGRAWTTLVGVRARDLLVPLPPNPDPATAAAVHLAVPVASYAPLGEGVVHEVYAGVSRPGPLADLDLAHLLGGFVRPEVTGTQNPTFSLPMHLYDGMAGGVGTTLYEPGVTAVGPAGRRVLWVLGANPWLSRVTQGAYTWLQTSPTPWPAGSVAADFAPYLADPAAASYLRPDTDLAPAPLEADGQPDPRDLPGGPLAFGPSARNLVRVRVPSVAGLPTAEYGDPAALLALVGVFVQGEGFTPLGMDLGADWNHDGQVVDVFGRDVDDLDVRYAPPSAGLEGHVPYLLLLGGELGALGGDDPAASPGRAGRLVPLQGLAFGAELDRHRPLLALPTGVQWIAAGRQGTGTFPAAAVHRWTLTGADGRRWVVYTPGDQATVQLPDESARCAAGSCHDPAGDVERVTATALVLDHGATLDALVGLDGRDLDRLPELTRDFARSDAAVQ